MARTQTKATPKAKKTAAHSANEMTGNATFQITLHQGNEKIILKLSKQKAKDLIRAVQKRNLNQVPLTVVDIHGMAHTIRTLDRSSYASELLTKTDLLTAII